MEDESSPIQEEDIDDFEEDERSPIQQEDIDDFEESLNDCLVCLQPCSTTSQDLFLYNCTCIYHIHNDCFRRWRETSQTNRICLICREELEPVEDDVPLIQIVRRRPIYILRNPGMDARIDEDVRTCCKKINDCFCNICLFFITMLLISVFFMVMRA
jgi:hypothetical protein